VIAPLAAVRPAPGVRAADPPGRAGFTLLEVLVALALLAGALTATSELVGAALRNHEYARELNTAVLLARARMAALEQQYEDSGFKDSDEEDSGDFSEAGRPEVRWKAQLLRPAPDLSADELLGRLAGQAGAKDAADLVAKLLGQQAPASGTGPTTAAAGPAVAMVTAVIQQQLQLFGETLKKSVRELRVTVTWPSGRGSKSFTATTHLVVITPRAPGGARGDFPDLPASLVAAGAVQRAGALGLPGLPGQPAKPGQPPTGGGAKP
jgi:general secretion pathway protein I